MEVITILTQRLEQRLTNIELHRACTLSVPVNEFLL